MGSERSKLLKSCSIIRSATCLSRNVPTDFADETKSIYSVMSGEYWISHSRMRDLVQKLRVLTEKVEQTTQFRVQTLSPQQQQIVESIIAGCSNKEIAKELSISERTVKYHLTRIFSKLGITGRTQLARFTLKNNAANMSSR